MGQINEITPIILAGGSGTRLWPLSRKSYPKQFAKLFDNDTLFQKTLLRLQSNKKIKFKDPIIVTNYDFRFIVSKQLQDISIKPGAIIIEPEPKNTAAAILAATLYEQKINPKANLLVLSSDHLIPDIEYFHNAIIKSFDSLRKGNIITFGVVPTRPETGYGYLELPKKAETDAIKVIRFLEKPKKKLAIEMFKDKKFLWNAGIFLFEISQIVDAFEAHCQNILLPVKNSFDKATMDLGFFLLEKENWSRVPNISIDYAIMENLKNLMAIPYYAKWTDLGDWEAIYQETSKDRNGIALSQNALAIDCKDSLLRSENADQEIVGIGLENILAISMKDAVLIADKNSSQKIKMVVEALEAKNRPQATLYPKDHRPWGWFESLIVGNQFQVKRLHVYPGASLSLQSHNYRSEHWVVVKGDAKITVDEKIKFLQEGQSVFIPLGAKHRLENTTETSLVIIEVQTGTYLGEDDIIRYEDLYSRQ